MKILALETSTEACSVAIWTDGAVRERFESGNQHSGRILAMVDGLLVESGFSLTQFDAIAFGRGPGSFTGLRIGAGVAQGLAFGADTPVVPVSSLAALAQGENALKVLAAFDAHMNQIYLGAFVRNNHNIVELIGIESVVAPSDARLPEGNDWVGAGNGWDQYHAALLARMGKHVMTWQTGAYPLARHIGHLGAVACQAGKALPAEQALPVYVRDDVAVKQAKARERGVS
ncbi:MAG: tRNA (adenosine(37)-N6)-threonylcarbamoyltransferase complex dimerization subunit type 1 TsaB [Sulfuricaulis sp.]|uniref:tRNA (adenosine(37)-N6)-threonylcarbamoyltransferase complex dimerization subunit type 1 TsaB n=1 Tax=Sulfuricaulis sp. TaxID=2003553 RepID=UPI0025DE8185|nr:tRNA (adenosine(37)-N6)-threonylcarbamoyltransferase complex dimerization subunit type 1 TsaB [Sulfuricaulis sp.]MCR4345611.1 tRNA (adenosine(37)-N6)-threonylcarbamoyltransferase complex dimerization subunit type 1 TsaB [Sulfuricaulis sp.]